MVMTLVTPTSRYKHKDVLVVMKLVAADCAFLGHKGGLVVMARRTARIAFSGPRRSGLFDAPHSHHAVPPSRIFVR